MKKIYSLLLILLLLLLTGPASASYWFKVTDISPINMLPNSEANFTVSVKGLGGQGAYVQLIFINKSQGINTSCEKLIKYVMPAGTTKYNCTVQSGDIAPGNYSFVVDVAARSAPSGRKTAYVNIIGPRSSAAEPSVPSSEELAVNATNQTSSGSEPKGMPTLGVVSAILALLLIGQRRR